MEILNTAGFNLCKFNSHLQTYRFNFIFNVNIIAMSETYVTLLNFSNDNHKTLGVTGYPSKDLFYYSFNIK